MNYLVIIAIIVTIIIVAIVLIVIFARKKPQSRNVKIENVELIPALTELYAKSANATGTTPDYMNESNYAKLRQIPIDKTLTHYRVMFDNGTLATLRPIPGAGKILHVQLDSFAFYFVPNEGSLTTGTLLGGVTIPVKLTRFGKNDCSYYHGEPTIVTTITKMTN